MTASGKQNKQTKQAPALPGVFLLLQDTLSMYGKYFSFFFGYSAWLLVPVVISVLARTTLDSESVQIIDLLFNVTLYVVLSVFITVIFIKSVPFLYTKKPITVELVRMATILTIPYILTVLIVNLTVLGGLILFIVPGVIVGTWFAFASIIVVVEQKRIVESLKASRALVKGRFWSVFWRYVGGHALILGAYFSAIILLMYTSFAFQGAENFQEFIQTPLSLGEDVALRFIDILFLPIGPVFTTLLYIHLKRR